MTDSTGSSALRLTAPAAQAYDTSPGELALLKDANFNNLGGMYGMLLNQRAIGQGNQAAYRSDLRGVNAQQYDLGQAKLEADRLEDLRRTAIAAMQHGGVDAGNLLPLQPLYADRGAVAQTDALRRQGSRAEAIQKLGAGMNSLSEAGVNLNPGQTVSLDPVQLGSLRSTTGTTRDERVAGIGANATVRAAGMRAAADDGVQVERTIGTLPGDDRTVYRGKNQQAVNREADAALAARSRGGTNGTTGPAAGAGGGTTGATGIRTPQQAVQLGRAQGLTAVYEQGGKWYGRDRQGATVPVR